MRLFGRPVSRYAKNLLRAPLLAVEAMRCVRLFESPARLLWSYITRGPVPGGVVRLRSGLAIHLSPDPLDVVTVMAVFVRRDYGKVPAGSRVIDIGANIGIFTLYALDSGAALVHAYEPSTESCEFLRRNVESNRCGDRVVIFQHAVGGAPDRTVRFPRRSNVYNALPGEGTATEDSVEVPLDTLATVVQRMTRVDLAKLDCEGAEEPILASADADTLSRIDRIRLEYHLGQGEAVARLMTSRGFATRRYWAADARGGLAWFDRVQQTTTSDD